MTKSIQDIDIHKLFKAGNLYVGQVEDEQAKTGITVVLAPDGMAAGLDVRGGGPASRDTRILDPLAAAEAIHAIMLAGGSAYGLDAAGGVMRYLEERGIGLEVGVPGVVVPLVCQSDIFDLGVGSSTVRPDADMAYAACAAALRDEWNKGETAQPKQNGNYQDGPYGVGCGATVGKVHGALGAQKSGIGSAAVQVGPLMVGAIVVVNALGDVIDPSTGQIIAGLHDENGAFLDSDHALAEMYAAQMSALSECASRQGADAAADAGFDAAGSDSPLASSAVTNTTIGIIFTNAALSKAQLCKVASMGHDGMARAVRPVHSSMDGDSLYAVSIGAVPATPDVVGVLAADVVARAICKAVE